MYLNYYYFEYFNKALFWAFSTAFRRLKIFWSKKAKRLLDFGEKTEAL